MQKSQRAARNARTEFRQRQSDEGCHDASSLQQLGVMPSFSRPATSNDNPYSESLFKTLKYMPHYPNKPFADITEARQWAQDFTTWYNTQHCHSGIRYVTPQARPQGKTERSWQSVRRSMRQQNRQSLNAGKDAQHAIGNRWQKYTLTLLTANREFSGMKYRTTRMTNTGNELFITF